MPILAFLLLVSKAITVIEALDDVATLLEGSGAALRTAQATGATHIPAETVAALGLGIRDPMGSAA